MYRANLESSEPVIFDRGIVDVLGYSKLIGLKDDLHLRKAVELYRYNKNVFIAPLWIEIYANDTERKQSFQASVVTFEAMVFWYEAAGYTLIELPCVSVKERAELILGLMRNQ